MIANHFIKNVRLSKASYVYGFLIVFGLVVSVFGDGFAQAYPPYARLLSILWVSVFGLTLLGAAFTLTYDGFRRWSRYGMSHNYRFFNWILSLFGAIGAFFTILIGPIAIVLSYVVIGFSFYKSPDDPAEASEVLFYQRRYFPYFLNAVLLSILLFIVFYDVLMGYIFGSADVIPPETFQIDESL